MGFKQSGGRFRNPDGDWLIQALLFELWWHLMIPGINVKNSFHRNASYHRTPRPAPSVFPSSCAPSKANFTEQAKLTFTGKTATETNSFGYWYRAVKPKYDLGKKSPSSHPKEPPTAAQDYYILFDKITGIIRTL